MRALIPILLLLAADPALAQAPERLLPPIVTISPGPGPAREGTRPFVLGQQFRARFVRAYPRVEAIRRAGGGTAAMAEAVARNGLTPAEYDEIIRMARDNPAYGRELAIALDRQLFDSR